MAAYIQALHYSEHSVSLSTVTYYIRGLSENTILIALWSHPHYWGLLFTNSLIVSLTKVVCTIHVICETKICHFNHPIPFNPGGYQLQWKQNNIILPLTCSF